jgi:molybdopterin-guanine dinucleotide biosynthesis protein MobB
VSAGARRRCVGVILAGGGATRYGGRPKGLERIGTRRIIDRVAEALRPVTDELLLISNDAAAVGWLPGVRVMPDVRTGEGALGGLHAALARAESDVLLVAWDMPFVPSVLLAELRRRGEAGAADAVLPSSDGSRRGVEPLCAWYAASCLPHVASSLDAGDRRVIAFHDAVRVERMALDEVERFGDPTVLFANVNTPEERARWSPPVPPPLLAIVGKKHAGKTTLTVRLAAELTRRGHRIMTLKHGSHTFNLDPAATDTYRHYHEGNAERVAMASPDKFALVMRWQREMAPEEIAARYLGEADLVLCEGFKASALPKIEIHRQAAHATALVADGPDNAASWRALVSDAEVGEFEGERFALGTDGWFDALADWVEREYLSRAP